MEKMEKKYVVELHMWQDGTGWCCAETIDNITTEDIEQDMDDLAKYWLTETTNSGNKITARVVLDNGEIGDVVSTRYATK